MSNRHVTASFAIAYVHYVTDGDRTLTVDQIRQWASRRKIARVGTDPAGFALYDLDDILGVVSRRVT